VAVAPELDEAVGLGSTFGVLGELDLGGGGGLVQMRQLEGELVGLMLDVP